MAVVPALAFVLALSAPPGAMVPAVRHSLLLESGRAEVDDAGGETVGARVVSVGGVERPALAAQSPSRLRFLDVEIPEGAFLAFGAGVQAPHDDGAAFQVAATVDGERWDLWAGRLDPRRRPEDRAWRDVQIDLCHLAGRRVALTFETEPLSGREKAWTAWSDPALVAPQAFPGRETPMAYVLSLDLAEAERARVPGGGDARRGPLHRMEVEALVPEGAVLELAGVVAPRRPPHTGRGSTVRFVASVDGVELLSRTLTTRDHASFSARIPLGTAIRRSLICLTAYEDGGWHGPTFYWRVARLLAPAGPAKRDTAGANLLLVLADTLRADRLGAYGCPHPTSPHLDRLARGAALFESAIAQSSWTIPSVGSLFSGLYPSEHLALTPAVLRPTVTPVAQVLRQRGLRTVGISANPLLAAPSSFDGGFERYCVLANARARHVNRLFADWVRAESWGRWFAYLHHMDAHEPYRAPPPFSGIFSTASPRKLRPTALDEAMRDRDLYDEDVMSWDADFGLLVAELRGAGVRESTIVAVVGDHGEEFLEHGQRNHGKQLYRESVHVPVVIQPPGVLPPLVRGPFELRSLMHHLFPLLALPAPAPWAAVPSAHAVSVLQHGLVTGGTDDSRIDSISDGTWRFVRNRIACTQELYDLRTDPAEKHDVLPAHPELGRAFEAILDAAQLRGPEARPPAPDPELVERLRALGYVR